MVWLEEKWRYWVAALVDGEGYIGIIANHHRGGRVWLQPQMEIGNYSLRLLSQFHDLYPQSHLWLDRAKSKSKGRPYYRVRIKGIRLTRLFLMEIEPFLIAKREQAREVLTYCNLRMRKWEADYKAPLTGEETDIMYRIRHLNKPLRNPETGVRIS